MAVKMRQRRDNKSYQALYDEFNHLYYNGRLPTYHVRVVDSISTRDTISGIVYRRRKLILLKKDSESQMTLTLLHEMAHVATTDNHRSKWYEEMLRLRQAGAPIPETEITTSPRITKQFIRDKAKELLLVEGGLKCTYLQFVRWFLSTHYGDSRAAFLRRYPWVPRVFSEVKKQARQDMTRQTKLLKEIAQQKAAVKQPGLKA